MPKAGFALLITITLLAFLVLLLVSLASLTRVETQVASNNQQLSQARQNAILALNIALGQLQKTAGPDQRVTATADILTATDATKRKWTGVWDTTAAIPAPTWLVSGPTTPTNTGAAALAATLTLAGGNASVTDVRLVGPNSADTTTAPANGNEIIVPLETVTATGIPGYPATTAVNIGKFGWWVGDEGVKASFKMTDPNLLPPLGYTANTKLSTLVAQRHGVERMTGWSTAAGTPTTINAQRPTDDYYPVNTNDVTKAVTRNQFPLVTPIASPAAGALQLATRQRFHDLAPLSRGVLADVKLGGLKRDLTAGLQPTAVSPNGPINNALTDNPIFPPVGGAASAADPGGPDWKQLREFHNLGTTAYDSGTGPATVMRSVIPGDYNHGLFPVMTMVQMGYHATFEGPAVPGTTHPVKIILLPVFSLWNPYNFDLKNTQDVYVHFEFSQVPNFCASVFNETDKDPVTAGVQPYLPRPATPRIAGGTNTIPNPANNTANTIPVATAAPNYPTLTPPINTNPFVNFDVPRRLVFKLNLNGVTIPAGQGLIFRPNATTALDATGGSNTLSSNGTPGLGFTISKTATSAVALGGTGNQICFPQGGVSNQVNIFFSTGSAFNPNPNLEKFPQGTYYAITGLAYNYYWGVGTQTGNTNANPYFLYKVINSTAAIDRGTLPLSITNNVNAAGSVVDGNIPGNGYYSAIGFTKDTFGYGAMVHNQWISRYNPRGTWAGRTAYESNSGVNDNATYITRFDPRSTVQIGSYAGAKRIHLIVEESFGGSPYLGTSTQPTSPAFAVDATNAVTKVVLFDAPTPDNPVLSIGQLMHANVTRNQGFVGLNTTPQTLLSSNTNPAYAIGNSFRNPRVPDQSTSYDQSIYVSPAGGTNIRRGIIYDYSYLLNQALWDKYFFSSVNPSAPTTFPLPSNPMALFLRENETLAGNSVQDPATTVQAIIKDYQKASSSLMVDGAFNINSTSVEAWQAILSSFYGQNRDVAGGGTDTSNPARQHPLGRFAWAPGQPIDSTQAPGAKLSENAQTYATARKLTNTEINALALSIVTAIKERRGAKWPFTSLAEFINRSLDSTATIKHRQFGVLQQAIDEATDTASSRRLNESFEDQISAYVVGLPALNGSNSGTTPRSNGLIQTGSTAPTYPANSDRSGEANSSGIGPVVENAPGYLSQADLLARLAPVLTARSDTFLVRTYGESLNPTTGETTGRAWLEATVQRLPDYVITKTASAGDYSWTTPATDANNLTFGRKFKVISFRWLSSNDL